MTEHPGYAPRLYPDIVRDLLTTLTGGTVRETVVAPSSGPIVLDRLRDRPIRRVSHLEGVTAVGTARVPVRFTAADFELVDTQGGGESHAIVFRENGRRPVPGSTLTVNYYPVQIDRPVPLTDLNVGSVVRTVLEAVGRELAVTEQYLDLIYSSAFVETAQGPSLDRVVALIGVRRLPAGAPVVNVTFSRNAALADRVTLPAGTPTIDAAGNRYLTVAELTLDAGELARSVLAAGVTADTGLAAAGTLRPEVAVAGVTTATNATEAFRQASAETDADLRRRARGALFATARGTLDALRFGVASVPGVRSVEVVEFPNGRPGEVRIDVAYESPDDVAAPAAVAQRVEELRPAGIRVRQQQAGRLAVRVRAALVLTGTGVPGTELGALTAGVEERVTARLGGLGPGATVRPNALTAAVLADARIADVDLTFAADDGTAIPTLGLAPGQVLDVLHPFTFPPPTAEHSDADAIVSVAHVDLTLPVHLAPGVTVAEATAAIGLAVDAHLAGRGPDAELTLDSVAAAIRDESRYALVRELASITVEHGDRFVQLLDGQGAYLAGPAETLQRRGLDVSEDGT